MLSALDEYDQQLLEHVHPSAWQNPQPAPRYHLVAIGGGTAGLVSAVIAAGLGGRVALVERHLLGGDCLNYGCVPSKALIRSSRVAHEVITAAKFGIETGQSRIDFASAMQRMRRLRARISHHDSAARLKELGIDVFLGDAEFVSPQALEVAGQRLNFKRCVIATGARPARPEIPGLERVDYLTNETVFSLVERPRRLLVIGTGSVGCELGQVFGRLGCDVCMFGRSERVLTRDEPEAAQIIAQRFTRDGVQLYLNTKLLTVEPIDGGAKLVFEREGQRQSLEGDRILVAVGRTPNVESLKLAAAGVEQSPKGVLVDDFLRTRNKRIYAAGDVIGGEQFTHAADAMARICIQNAFFFGRKRLSRLMIPHTTYTDPEVAQIGMTRALARERGVEVTAYREQLARVDRAILDDEEDGYAEVLCRKGTGHIVGATIVAAHAGELIGQLLIMMNRRTPLSALSSVVYPYPTQAEILKRLGDQFQRSRVTPLVAKVLRFLIKR